MDPQVHSLVDISQRPASIKARAETLLERARWASQIFERYDRMQTMRIVASVAEAAHAKAREYADWAVRETGFGVTEHKAIKNQLTTLPFVEFYKDRNFVEPEIDSLSGIVKIPKPAGVIFALTPSTNPIATIYFKVLSALMTRNAIVVSPHPAALDCSVDAAKMLSDVASSAGAPEGTIQVLEDVNLKVIDEFMRSKNTNVILATGGSAMVRAAYSSANPAIGVGPGNAPVFVDEDADLRTAAKSIVESKSFDNSVLCTNESVLITVRSVDKHLRQELSRGGAHICNEEQTSALRRYLFCEPGFNVEALGRDASWIASQAGFKVAQKTKILVTPIMMVGEGEPLSREKLCPVLGYYVSRDVSQAIAQARAVLRFAGTGHSAAIHSNNAQNIMNFSAKVEVCRVVVNAPCSQGAAGFSTNLAPTFTIGTGFFGRSSVGENIGPQHLINWTQIAWNKENNTLDPSALENLEYLGPLPNAPSDGVPGEGLSSYDQNSSQLSFEDTESQDLREKIRKIIIQELQGIVED